MPMTRRAAGCHRGHALRRAVMVGLIGWSASGLVIAQAPGPAATECTEQRILGNTPGQTATLQLCLPSLRRDPALLAMLDRIGKLAAQGDEQRRQVDKLVQALGRTSGELTPAQLNVLAASVARRLAPGPQPSDAAVLREVQRLQLNLEELQERLGAALADKAAAAPTRQALAGDLGDAVTRLDFAAAMKRLEDQLEKRKSACEADANLLALARRDAETGWSRLATARAEARCGRDWPNLLALRKAAQDAEARQDAGTACSAHKDLQERAERVAGELLYYDQAEQAYRQGYEQLLSPVGSMRDLQRRQVRTPQHAEGFQFAEGLFQKAQALAASGRHREAMNQLQDAMEAYRVAVPNPYSVKPAFVHAEPTPPYPGALCR